MLDERDVHPNARARILRSLRDLGGLPGWRRMVDTAYPFSRGGDFIITDGDRRLAGSLGSYIERQVYFYGWYEKALIEAFIALTSGAGRTTILDVGANIGSHSIYFARFFKTVQSFEPNPQLWPKFQRNIALNNLRNVTLHTVGLGDRDGELPFFNIANGNEGLGTFSTAEQYDQPLSKAGAAVVRTGDAYLHEIGCSRVDAIKIDVQGFEPQVLTGLRETLRRDRPVVWIEIGAGAEWGELDDRSVASLFPYAVTFTDLRAPSSAMGVSGFGNYLVTPTDRG